MNNILVTAPTRDGLNAQLVALYHTFSQVQKISGVCNFDLSQLKWIHPLLILPIASHIKDTGSTFTPPSDKDACSYLEAVKFPFGATSLTEFQKIKSFIPISFLSKTMDIKDRESIESCFGNLIYKTVGETSGTKDAIFYPITELVGNIFQHSKKGEGWLLGQIYKKKNFLDLCILDSGRGLKKAYQEELGMNDISDSQSIEKAMKGLSIKPDHERGYGIRTSKKLVCEGMGGSFILLSGQSALLANRQNQKLANMNNLSWKGVIIAYRIPFPSGTIDITPFIE